MRTKHTSQLQEDIKDLSDRIQFKEKLRERATLARNYKLCDQLAEGMSDLKKRREYEGELGLWKRKQQQSSWYKRSNAKSPPGSPSNMSEQEIGSELIIRESCSSVSPRSSVSSTPLSSRGMLC